MMQNSRIVLGNLISSASIQVDPSKVEVIVHLLVPKSQKEVRIFLGYVGYYRIFIENFYRIATPLICLISKDNDLFWNEEELKDKLTQAYVLRSLKMNILKHLF